MTRNCKIGVFGLLALLLFACKGENDKANQAATHELINDKAFKKLTCYFFFIADCPASRNNLPKMVQLGHKYAANGLSIIGVVSEPMPDNEKLQLTLETFHVDFAIEMDSTLALAKTHGATVTPQVMLYNENSELIYSGLLDDYYIDLGTHRKNVKEHYLEQAIVNTLNGEPVTLRKTEPLGCIINFFKPHDME